MWSIVLLWAEVPLRWLDYPIWKTKNCSHSIDAHILDGATHMSCTVRPEKANHHSFEYDLVQQSNTLLRPMPRIMFQQGWYHSIIMRQCYIQWHIIQRTIHRLSAITIYMILNVWELPMHLKRGDLNPRELRTPSNCYQILKISNILWQRCYWIEGKHVGLNFWLNTTIK